LLWPTFAEDEIEAAAAVLRSGKANYWTGEEGRRFEEEFAQAFDCQYGIALANGTLALEAALLALDIGAGDEVIVTPRSYSASASCVVTIGARPVFADIDPVSQNLTAETIEAALSEKTRAILLVHLAGWPCDMDPIIELAKARNLKIIEDCAQAHGAEYKGRKIGSMGHAAAFSFCQDKIMTTGGEGGMLLTQNRDVWLKAWSLKDHGKSHDVVFNKQHPEGFRWLMESFGSNWRLSEMQSAIGRLQLKKLPDWHAKRTSNAAMLNQALSGQKALPLTLPPADITHAYYKYYAFLRPEQLKPDWSQQRIVKAVQAEGFFCGPGACSEIYLEKAFQNAGLAPKTRLPQAKALGETSLMLEIHPTLAQDQVQNLARHHRGGKSYMTGKLHRRGLIKTAATLSLAAPFLNRLPLLPPALAQTGATSPADLPWNNRFYGNPFHADTVADLPVKPGGDAAVRFRAERSGQLQAVNFQVRGNYGREGAGYSHGDGGLIQIELQGDRGGIPDGQVLAKTSVNNGLGRPYLVEGGHPVEGRVPKWFFESPANLEAGRRYHLVYKNLAKDGADNYWAINPQRAYSPIPEGSLRAGPYWGDDCAILQRKGDGWQLWPQHFGFFQFFYNDGHVTGSPIIHSSQGFARSFGGGTMVREHFHINDYPRLVSGVWFRVWWRGVMPSDLHIRLEHDDGLMIEQMQIPAGSLPRSRNSLKGGNPAPWTYRPFRSPRQLEMNVVYALRFSATSGSYQTHACQRGNAEQHGLATRNAWVSARAEETSNGGLRWQGFENTKEGPGVARSDVHLTAAFTVVG